MPRDFDHSDYYDTDEKECPNCNSPNVLFKNSAIENTDRDGNRGIKVNYYVCEDCEEEFGYYA